ncbi:uncharacterized protein LOC130826197 isoform X1 [Amaranthus tricolor]|uniref:uncharacterized protein LOC130826197 isoform X1 n=1 Tax=Amaranthus tricolor TaxID=29722 RepID=UPI002585D84F|nr:uncharacterized protein LOC130826197 isoform X1 [Amaranthus tricolor]
METSVVPNEGLKDLLKPFYSRASEAEDRLSKLEAVVSSKKADSEVGIGNEEFAKKVKELELKLEGLTAELTSEREKVAKLIVENDKKEYRILHLVRSLKETDLKLEKSTTK